MRCFILEKSLSLWFGLGGGSGGGCWNVQLLLLLESKLNSVLLSLCRPWSAWTPQIKRRQLVMTLMWRWTTHWRDKWTAFCPLQPTSRKLLPWRWRYDLGLPVIWWNAHLTSILKGIMKKKEIKYLLKDCFLLLCLLQIHETIEYINQLKTERDFMLSFSNNPQEFIQDWLKSQSRDLKVNISHQHHINCFKPVYTTNSLLEINLPFLGIPDLYSQHHGSCLIISFCFISWWQMWQETRRRRGGPSSTRRPGYQRQWADMFTPRWEITTPNAPLNNYVLYW